MASIARKRLKKIVQMNKKLLEQNDKESTIFTDERYRMPVCCHGTENLHYLFYNLITFTRKLSARFTRASTFLAPAESFQRISDDPP